MYYALEHSKNVVHKIILFSLISHKTQVVGVFKCVYWSVNTLITARRKHSATDTADCHYWLPGHSSDFWNCCKQTLACLVISHYPSYPCQPICLDLCGSHADDVDYIYGNRYIRLIKDQEKISSFDVILIRKKNFYEYWWKNHHFWALVGRQPHTELINLH